MSLVCRRARRGGLVALGLAIGLIPVVGRAADMDETPPAGEAPVKPQGLTDQESNAIRRRLDTLTKQHQELVKTIEEIKAELAVIKVRVTN